MTRRNSYGLYKLELLIEVINDNSSECEFCFGTLTFAGKETFARTKKAKHNALVAGLQHFHKTAMDGRPCGCSPTGCNRKLLLPKGIYCWCYKLLLDVRAVYYGPSHQACVAASSTQMASWQRVGTKCGWLGGWMDALVVVLDGHGFVRKEGEGAIVS